MTKPNRDLDNAGFSLQHVIAPGLTDALEHLARELHNIDGHGERGEQLGVRSTSELTSTERAADARFDLRCRVEDLRDAKDNVLVAIRILNDQISAAMRVRAPRIKTTGKPQGLCDQTGKEGAIEWGDPLCVMTAVKAGMCQTHYTSWYRHRLAVGIDVSNDHQPI